MLPLFPTAKGSNPGSLRKRDNRTLLPTKKKEIGEEPLWPPWGPLVPKWPLKLLWLGWLACCAQPWLGLAWACFACLASSNSGGEAVDLLLKCLLSARSTFISGAAVHA